MLAWRSQLKDARKSLLDIKVSLSKGLGVPLIGFKLDEVKFDDE